MLLKFILHFARSMRDTECSGGAINLQVGNAIDRSPL